MATVKKAISLQKAQDDRLKKLARERKMAYSAVVQVAVQLLLDSEEERDLLAGYRAYFADSANASQVRESVRRFQGLSRKAWE